MCRRSAPRERLIYTRATQRGPNGSIEGREPTLRGRAQGVACAAAWIPHQRAADLEDAEGALALPQQCAGHVLRAAGIDPHLHAGAEGERDAEAGRDLCGATAPAAPR